MKTLLTRREKEPDLQIRRCWVAGHTHTRGLLASLGEGAAGSLWGSKGRRQVERELEATGQFPDAAVANAHTFRGLK